MSRPVTDDPNLERPGVRWTPEEESYLRWAYSQGLSLEWTAKHLGRSVDATKAKAYRLGGLQHPRYGPGAGATGDLARRLADLQGLSPETEKVPEPLQDEALRRFVDDPAALFAWLGIDLFPYQAKGLGLESRMKPDRSQRYLDAEPELLRHLLQKYAPRRSERTCWRPWAWRTGPDNNQLARWSVPSLPPRRGRRVRPRRVWKRLRALDRKEMAHDVDELRNLTYPDYKGFIKRKSNRTPNEATLRRYWGYVQKMQGSRVLQGDLPLETALNRYLLELDGYATNTLIVVHSALNWAFRALHLKDEDGEPYRYPVPGKEVRHNKPVVSAQGWKELEPLIRARTNPREYACIRVLRDSSLRPSDVASIRLDEVHLDEGAPRIEKTTQKAGVPV